MGIGTLDMFAVTLATVTSMIVGTIWYAALGHVWRRAARIGADISEPPIGVFAMTLACEFVMACVLALLIHRYQIVDLSDALTIAGTIWFGFIATTLVVNTRFRGFDWDLPLIDGGHWLMVLASQATVFAIYE